MGNVHMEATQINYRGGSKKMSVEEAIKAAGTEITPEEKTWIDSIPTLASSKADNDVIAPEFDSEAGVYAIGDLVMYEGKLYEFTTAHETAGDWDSTEVTEKTVADEIGSVKSGLIDVNSNLSTLNGKRIQRDLIDNGNSAITITFSGSGHTRCANMLLILATQSKVYTPISILFKGVQGSNQSITEVVVSDNDLGVTTSGLSISIPANLSGWGYHMLMKLYPDDNIAVSVT